MILADTSIWADHLRRGNKRLVEELDANNIVTHPFAICELALGNLKQRDVILDSLLDLPAATTASHDEMLTFIREAKLAGAGIGLVDAHLLAAARLAPGTRLWTDDTRLRTVAERLDLSVSPK